jgi:hypothetical protein
VPTFTAENAAGWQAIANDLSKDRPYVGRWVAVERGRKHKGKMGRVLRHQRDKFSDAYRYGSGASDAFKDMAGTYGWVCMVENAATGERFWVRADYLKIVPRPTCDE